MEKSEKEQMTVRDMIENVIEEICDKYCHYPYIVEEQELMERYCAECPLNRL